MSDVLAHETRTCPYCGEPIQVEARKCTWCAEWLDDVDGRSADRSVNAATRFGLASAGAVAGKAEAEDSLGQAVAAAARPKTSGLAVASFLFAVLGAGLGAIPALALGTRARREIQQSGRHIGGLGWALAGQVLGGIQLTVLVVIAFILLGNGHEERALPPTPDGPIPVTRVFAEEGLLSAVSAVKSGDLVSVSFTLNMRADECKASTWPDGGEEVTDLLEPLKPGVHTITVTRSGSSDRVWLSCNRPLEDLISEARNDS